MIRENFITRFSMLMEHHDPRVSKEEILQLIGFIGDDKKVIDNWDNLLKYGIDAAYLLGIYASEIEYVGFPDCLNFLLDEKHVPVSSVFVLVRDQLAQQEEDDILSSIDLLSAHGLDDDLIRIFIKNSLPIEIIVHNKWSKYLNMDDSLDAVISRFLNGSISYDDLMENTDELELLSDEQKKRLDESFQFFIGQWEDDWDEDTTPYELIRNQLNYRTIDALTEAVEFYYGEKNMSVYEDLDMSTILLLNGADLDAQKILEKIQEKEAEDKNGATLCGEYYGCVALANDCSNNTIRKELLGRMKAGDRKELRDSVEYVISLFENRGNGIVNEDFRSTRTLMGRYDYGWCCGFMDACKYCREFINN